MFLKIETQHFYNEKGVKRLMPIGFKKKEGEGLKTGENTVFFFFMGEFSSMRTLRPYKS